MKQFIFGKINQSSAFFTSSAVAWSIIIFIISLIVRFLIWQDTRFDAWKVQTGIVELYRLSARFLIEDGFLSLLDSQARIANPDLLGHPPGYSVLLAAIFTFTGESNTAIQVFSIIIDAFSSVLIFLIVKNLFSRREIGLIAGCLAAFCPSFALNSVYFLPDTLSVFPILLAAYFFVLAHQKTSILYIILCGAALGLSCWMRSNGLLLPVFFSFAAFVVFRKQKRFFYASVLLVASVLTIAPITLRNAIVYGEFVPISLGAGQILLEGIGDYDREQKFGIPNSDFGICQTEAVRYNRPDYAISLFGADGIERDRWRIKQGIEFISENPWWFSKVYAQRAFSILRLERAQLVSPEIPVTREPLLSAETTTTATAAYAWESSIEQLSDRKLLLSPTAAVEKSADANSLILRTDDSRFDAQFAVETIALRKNVEYLLNLNLHIKKGRISLKINGVDSGKTYNSAIVEFDEFDEQKGMTFEPVNVPFVLSRDEKLKLLISNETGKPPASVLEIKQLRILELGEASYTWTRPLRFLIGNFQKLFVSGIILPLAFFGLAVLIRRKEFQPAVILLIVPVYYICFQSFLHTEYRYVLALHYFIFSFAAVGLSALILKISNFFGHRLKNSFSRVSNAGS